VSWTAANDRLSHTRLRVHSSKGPHDIHKREDLARGLDPSEWDLAPPPPPGSALEPPITGLGIGPPPPPPPPHHVGPVRPRESFGRGGVGGSQVFPPPPPASGQSRLDKRDFIGSRNSDERGALHAPGILSIG